MQKVKREVNRTESEELAARFLDMDTLSTCCRLTEITALIGVKSQVWKM